MLNEEVFVFTRRILFHLKLQISITCRNALILKKKIKDKLCSFITLYRSPNQCQDTFESSINNFELSLDSVVVNNPFLTVVLGDFNVKTSLWHNKDITAYEGSKIDGVTFQFWIRANYRRTHTY